MDTESGLLLGALGVAVGMVKWLWPSGDKRLDAQLSRDKIKSDEEREKTKRFHELLRKEGAIEYIREKLEECEDDRQILWDKVSDLEGEVEKLKANQDDDTID